MKLIAVGALPARLGFEDQGVLIASGLKRGEAAPGMVPHFRLWGANRPLSFGIVDCPSRF